MLKKITLASLLAMSLTAPAAYALDFGSIIDSVGGIAQAAGVSDKAVKGIGAATDGVKAYTLSDAEVNAYAAQMAVQIDSKNTIAPASSPYTQRLSKIMKGWGTVDGLKLNFKVYMAQEANAFAMGDGTVRINSGLMDIMTDDELRFVLGHEIGHVRLGHSKAHLKTALASSAVFKGAAAAGGRASQIAGSEYAQLADKFLSAQFSQAHENASDTYGLQLLKAKKINLQAAVTSMNKIAALGDSGGGLMSTHPSSKDRVSNLQKQIDTMR